MGFSIFIYFTYLHCATWDEYCQAPSVVVGQLWQLGELIIERVNLPNRNIDNNKPNRGPKTSVHYPKL